MSENTPIPPIPGDLYMLLGKMDGKMDQNLAATNTLAIEVKELAHQQNALQARVAVVEKESEKIAKNGHEIANIKQSLEGRSEQVREFRNIVEKVNKIEEWRVDHDAQEKGQSKFIKAGQAAIPVILSILAALGISLGIKNKGAEPLYKNHVESTTTSTVSH